MVRTATLIFLALAGCASGAGAGPENKAGAQAAPDPDVAAYRAAVEAQFRAPGVVATGLGGTARLGDVAVRPLAILEDSRCPHDARCVWAGRLRLRVTIAPRPGEAELILGEAYPLAQGGTITLVAAAPERWNRPPPGLDARAPLRFGFRRD